MRAGPHTVRLYPDAHHGAQISDYRLAIDPVPSRLDWHYDAAQNWVARATFAHALTRLTIDSSFQIALADRNPFDIVLDPQSLNLPMAYDALTRAALAPYLDTPMASEGLTAFVAQAPRPKGQTLAFVVSLAGFLANKITYEVRESEGVLSPDEVWNTKVGSCRDTAWLLILLLRTHGIAARFVSGYLIDVNDDTPTSGEPELHAWAETYLPGAGWIGLDTTSGFLTQNHHIALARGLRPETTAPVEGTREAAGCKVDWTIEVIEPTV